MADPQPDKFTKLSNELYEAIMKTDFSKRQRNILDLVIRMSYGCRKKSAVLRPSDFEVVGILRGHVKKELDYLQMVNVLHIEGEIYSLNKDYDTWRISISKAFNMDKYQKILNRNLVENVTETVTNVTKTVTEFSNDSDEMLPKREQDSYQNSNTLVTKTVTGTPSEPNQDMGSRVPKDSIKDSIKDSSTRSIGIVVEQDSTHSATSAEHSFGHLYKIFEEHFTESGKVSSLEVEDLTDQFESYGGEWLLEAMREAVRAKKKSLSYINGVLKGFKKRGTCKRDDDTENGDTGPPASDDPMFSEDDPIMRMLQEGDRLRRGAGTATAV